MFSRQACEQARISRDPRFDGLFFVLVKTTKIFCRNTCKVRLPLEKNVEYSESAQQALNAGYRPCLRCRPDSAPMSCAWQGVNTTVLRALRMLSEDMEHNIEAIATRLGVTTRYLNKLLQRHIQMSAKRFRVYQQVLMAKQLIQQTNLSIEKVAQSVGFTSARQLQQHIKTHLRLTPTQLRATVQDNNTDVCFKDNVELLLAYRPPYNWPQVRAFFARRAIGGNEEVNEQSLRKILRVENQAVQVTLRHAPDKNGFYVKFNAAYSKHTIQIIAIVRRMLDLDADPIAIRQALLKAGLKTSELVEGLRIPGVASQFEAACRAILGQQVSVSAAVNNVNRLHQFFCTNGANKSTDSDHTNEQLVTSFVSAKTLSEHDLQFLKMPAARRQTLINTASMYASGELKQVDFSGADYQANQAVMSQLMDIKGIGPWTVNYVKLRALGDADVWLNSDLVIKQQTAKIEQNNRQLQPELAAPWRSYLTLNLWSLAG